jgi:hypothetical protein
LIISFASFKGIARKAGTVMKMKRVKTREEKTSLAGRYCLACLPAHTVSQQLPSINCVSHFWNLVLFFGLLCAAHALGQATGDHPRLLFSLKDERIPSLDFDSLFSCFSSGPIYLLSM